MIHKTFDEMTGNGQVLTDSYVVYETKGFLVTKTNMRMKFGLVVGDDFRAGWLIVNSHMLEWQFAGHHQVLALVDGNRSTFEGVVRTSDANFVGDTLYCDEEFHVAVPEEFLQQVATSNSAKIRLAGIDVMVPQLLQNDVRDLIRAI